MRVVILSARTGWQTDEILLRGAVESFLISTGAASLALLLAFVWLEPLTAQLGLWAATLLSGPRTSAGVVALDGTAVGALATPQARVRR